MNKFSYLTPKNNPKSTGEIISPYDTLENLNFSAQKILSMIDKFNNQQAPVKKLIEEVKEEIMKLLHFWEDAIEAKRIDESANSKYSEGLSLNTDNQKQQEKDCKDEMMLMEAQYEDKLKNLEDQLKKSEEFKQRIHSFHQDCLRELTHNLDEIIHDYKQRHKPKQNIGNILDDLFSKEELEQEHQVALGKIRENIEVKITKLNDSKSEKWDMNLDSDESSGPPPDLEGSSLLLYDRLHELKIKINKLRNEDLDNLGNKDNSLDQGFLGSLPVSMKSISSSQSIKLDDMLSSLEGSIEKFDIPFEFNNELLTLDDKENFIMTLIDKEGTNGQDACLEDILSIENSEQKEQALDSTLSFLEGSSKIKKEEMMKIEEEKKSLEGSKNDLDIRLSPISTPKNGFKKKDLIENLSQESSIVINENNNSSFISENSFLNDDRNKGKALKKSEKSILRRPKISDHDDSNSSIFPPINTSSEEQSFRLPLENKILRRLPLIPYKPICAPPKDRFNVRGRSLLPIQNSVGNSPKISIPVENSMNKSASPNAVNNLRMRRYKEMTRPFVKILNKKLMPKEPLGLKINNGNFY
ncbi:hypothetical protein SteCoe_19474 [Stentor coeruleus]|uniref:Uncharacterized protein n=1 Tax=Stentor coeruleus TaxID=5963 RepID=A0A1R2BU38_9CILI|nr:hypothetical protein SteCoe_19474 [Stentor coeruleus]